MLSLSFIIGWHKQQQQGEEMGALSLLNLVKSEEEGLCGKRGPCGLDFVLWKHSSDNFDLYNLVLL